MIEIPIEAMRAAFDMVLIIRGKYPEIMNTEFALRQRQLGVRAVDAKDLQMLITSVMTVEKQFIETGCSDYVFKTVTHL